MRLAQSGPISWLFLLTCRVNFTLQRFFCPRTDTTVVVEEGAGALFLTVSRSNGLETAVSVEWETVSEKAMGMEIGRAHV